MWKQENRLYLKKDEAIKISNDNNLPLLPQEITGQSLLTCDALGNWKFAHKSIMEFFLAKEAKEHPKFLAAMNFFGMDMAKKFYYELENPFIYFDQLALLEDVSESDRASKQFLDRLRTISKSFPFFVNPNCIYEGEVSNVSYVSLTEAKEYCNAFNKKNGYPDVYNTYSNPGSFLDKDGRITQNLKDVHGFRLPTSSEWEQLFSNEYKVPANYVDDLNISGIKAGANIIEMKNSGIFEFLVLPSGEWCCDTNEHSVKTVTDQTSIEDNSTGAEMVLKFIETASKVKPLEKTLKANRYAFRMVFVP